VPTTMLWRNWNPALLIAINEMAVNAVTELAARKIRKSAAFRGDFRRCSSGEKTSTPAINTAPKTTAKVVVMIADVLKILRYDSFVGSHYTRNSWSYPGS